MSKNIIKNINKYLADIWVIGDNKYLFPEIQSKMYNPEGVGISISGGGSRSYTAMIGYMRALNKLLVNGEPVFNLTQFISSISGGGWFTGVYLLAGNFIEETKLLAKSYNFDSLKNVTLEQLKQFNLDTDKYYMGKRVTKSDILTHVLDGFLSGIKTNELWNYSIGKIFLEPYGCANRPICLNESEASKIFDITKVQPCVIRPKSPFWIVDSTIIYNSLNNPNNPNNPNNLNNPNNSNNIMGINTVQFTPLYSGIPNLIKINNSLNNSLNMIGGVWQSTYSFNSSYPDNLDLENKLTSQQITLNKFDDCFCSDNIIGCSSNAYGDIVHSSKDKNYGDLTNFVSKYNIWTPEIPLKNDEFCVVDGYLMNNTSIISLIQRKVKKIICFNSVQYLIDKSNYTNDSWRTTDLPNLFKNQGPLQIFESIAWDTVAKNLVSTSNTGLPMYSKEYLKVLPNPSLYIEGNYTVEILFIILQPSTIFNDLLPKEIVETFSNANGPFPKFPNYPTVSTNFGKFIELTNGQVNLLSTYTEWSIMETELKNIILDMYK